MPKWSKIGAEVDPKIKDFSSYVHKGEFLEITFLLQTCRKNQGFAGRVKSSMFHVFFNELS